MTDKEFVLSIYPEANVEKKYGYYSIQFHAGKFRSFERNSEAKVWKLSKEWIVHNMLRKLEQ